MRNLLPAVTVAALMVPTAVPIATALRAEIRPNTRAAMIGEIERSADRQYSGIGSTAHFRAAIAALGTIDRARFVPPPWNVVANNDTPLPIGYAQTISDPLTVTLMTAAVGAQPGSNVLEIGTGSGFQAAVLSRIGSKVHTIEIVAPLARRAKRLLDALHFANVWVRVGDGFAGWPFAAPFDGIIVTAGTAQVPQPLIDQLRIGGRMAIPIGATAAQEQLLVLTKLPSGALDRCTLGPTLFVSLMGKGLRSGQELAERPPSPCPLSVFE